ncbi:MAG: hypothetical protein BWY14_01127 [Parcubacteria group bacterium ADurb.Bin192]|nr:MAG: hypothetical protein BWY14_01127 [Parcubacteria group bacterium ADurb.Bin192]
MKNLAPNIIRERLLIEGFFSASVDKQFIEDYFKKITAELGLKMYGDPIIFSPGGLGKEENQGYDAFVPLIDSGISVYVWGNQKFLSVILYTCKTFNQNKAVQVTKDFFQVAEVESMFF